MSNFIVSDRHIDALVRTAMEFTGGDCLDFTIYKHGECINYDNPNRMGQVLKDLAYYSANKEYRQNNKMRQYRYSKCELLSSVQILKACDCYDYQCADVGDYDSTEAARIIDNIRRFYIQTLDGYDTAKWHIA